MVRIIEIKREELARLCVRYHVCRLELFGSAAGDRFDPARSDLDFLVVEPVLANQVEEMARLDKVLSVLSIPRFSRDDNIDYYRSMVVIARTGAGG